MMGVFKAEWCYQLWQSREKVKEWDCKTHKVPSYNKWFPDIKCSICNAYLGYQDTVHQQQYLNLMGSYKLKPTAVVLHQSGQIVYYHLRTINNTSCHMAAEEVKVQQPGRLNNASFNRYGVLISSTYRVGLQQTVYSKRWRMVIIQRAERWWKAVDETVQSSSKLKHTETLTAIIVTGSREASASVNIVSNPMWPEAFWCTVRVEVPGGISAGNANIFPLQVRGWWGLFWT